MGFARVLVRAAVTAYGWGIIGYTVGSLVREFDHETWDEAPAEIIRDSLMWPYYAYEYIHDYIMNWGDDHD